MSLKPTLNWSALAYSSLLLTACGPGEIGSPSGPFGADSDNDGVPDSIDPNPQFADPDDQKALDQNNGGSGVGGRQEELSFSCNPNARTEKQLQRLARTEFANSIGDLIRTSTSAATASAVMTSLQSVLNQHPNDTVTKNTPFGAMDQNVSQAHIDSWLRVGGAVAGELTSSAQRINELVGSCASAPSQTVASMASCIDGFIASFGKRVLRHDLNQQERSFYREVYAAEGTSIDAEGLADLITVMLNAPDFVYRVEFGKEQVAGNSSLFKLSDYELATRLAYLFWQTTPDQELLTAADRGELSSDAGFQRALDRVLSDPRTGQSLEHFTREWLALDSLRPLDSLLGTPVFEAFAGDDRPSATLKEEMISDVTQSFSYHALSEQSTLSQWLESPYSFAKSQGLAAIYNVPVWSGKGEPPRFPEGERAGLITRAGMLATGSANTRPIMKGVMIRERLLCDHLAPPPANAQMQLPDLSGDKTTRELVESITQQPGSQCAGCHVAQINPLGFATEGFDALGRVRTEQDLYDQSGEVMTSKPVDTTSVPRVWMSDTTPSDGAQDLTSMLVDSGKVEACFARKWTGYAEARLDDEQTDGCELETVRSALSEGESIKEALRRFAMMPQFRQRYVPAT